MWTCTRRFNAFKDLNGQVDKALTEDWGINPRDKAAFPLGNGLLGAFSSVTEETKNERKRLFDIWLQQVAQSPTVMLGKQSSAAVNAFLEIPSNLAKARKARESRSHGIDDLQFAAGRGLPGPLKAGSTIARRRSGLSSP